MDPEAKPTPGYLKRSLCTELLSVRKKTMVMMECWSLYFSHISVSAVPKLCPTASEKSTVPSLKRSLELWSSLLSKQTYAGLLFSLAWKHDWAVLGGSYICVNFILLVEAQVPYWNTASVDSTETSEFRAPIFSEDLLINQLTILNLIEDDVFSIFKESSECRPLVSQLSCCNYSIW